MAKKRVIVRWIENERARKCSYKKRIEALRKKLNELCTLCEIKSFMIVSSLDFKEPFVWPSNEDVKELMARFNSLSKFHQTKNMVTNEQYIQAQADKIKDEISKQEFKNKKTEASILMHKILNGKGMREIIRPEDVELLKCYSLEKLRDVQLYKRCFPKPPQA